MSETIHVALGERSYDIHAGEGLLAQAGALLAPFARGLLHGRHAQRFCGLGGVSLGLPLRQLLGAGLGVVVLRCLHGRR